jgi:hypothetical protein
MAAGVSVKSSSEVVVFFLDDAGDEGEDDDDTTGLPTPLAYTTARFVQIHVEAYILTLLMHQPNQCPARYTTLPA